MSILSDEERAALRALPRLRGRVRRAEALVNPASGLANDYLNLFNEIVMLVEQLPTMLELIDDIQRWHPVSYRDYFERSVLPGRMSAIAAYEQLDEQFRRAFEAIVAELDARATGAVAAVRKHVRNHGESEPVMLATICGRAGGNIRSSLDKATSLVNHGVEIDDIVQVRTDTLFAGAASH